AWKKAGDGPLRLVAGRSTVTHYLGLDQKKVPTPGKSAHFIPSSLLTTFTGICVADKLPPRRVTQTLTGQHIPTWSTRPGFFKTSKQLQLQNGDTCLPRNFVIANHPYHAGETFVGRVEEIIQQVGSVADYASQPDGVLLQKTIILRERDRYGMPSIQLSQQWSMHTTAQTVARVEHTQNVDDVVLNTAQMRDAVHVQRYRLDSTPMDVEHIITQSAAREIGARKAKRRWDVSRRELR
ncbi:hypothetical protein DFH06DRAFT_908926, partial [Mycena polygramma]